MAAEDHKRNPNAKRIVWKVVKKAFQEGPEEVYSASELGNPDPKLYRIEQTTVQEKDGAAILVLFSFEASRAFASDRPAYILKGWTQTLLSEKERMLIVSSAIGDMRFCHSFHPPPRCKIILYRSRNSLCSILLTYGRYESRIFRVTIAKKWNY